MDCFIDPRVSLRISLSSSGGVSCSHLSTVYYIHLEAMSLAAANVSNSLGPANQLFLALIQAITAIPPLISPEEMWPKDRGSCESGSFCLFPSPVPPHLAHKTLFGLRVKNGDFHRSF